jgi:2-aminoadipate transaminase
MTFQNTDALFSTRAQSLKPSAIREIHKLLEIPDMRSLAGAWPDPAVFQSKEISKIISTLLKECADQTLQYGSTGGYIELRKVLAEQASKNDGIQCTPEQILITTGSAQGMDLACRTFINPDDIVLVGLPSYFGGTSTVTAYGGRNIGIPIDEDGLRVELMEDKLEAYQKAHIPVKAVYTIPNFQNPTGVTLSLERRKMLLELANRFQFIIFEDDPYGELRFEGEHLPSLAAMDKHGYVIHFRSTSKTFSPGMRVAWAVGRSEIIEKMELAKQFTDIASNTLAQFVLLELIKTGAMQRAIKNNIEYYRKKRDLTLKLVEKHFPEQVSWTKPKGGFFMFVTLPNELNADDLLADALNHKIAFVSGSSFFVDGGGKNTFRLSYSQSSPQDIEAAIPTLGDLIRKRINP